MRVWRLGKRVCALVVLVSVMNGAFAQKKAMELEDLFQRGTFRQKTVRSPMSMRDGEHYTALENGTIARYRLENGERDGVLLDKAALPDSLQKKSFASYALSPNEEKLLLPYDWEQIYRRSSRSNYAVYDIKDKTIRPLSTGGKQRLATFSPDSRMVAFARSNNVYIVDLEKGTELAITSDGAKNRIINGAADWVYEEEFAMATALWWSPNARYLAYLKFDEARVKQYTMPLYGDGSELYPEQYTFKYPKAGEANSVVSLWVYDTQTQQTQRIDVGQERNQYIPRVLWSPTGQLYYIRMNRLQNDLKLLQADLGSGKSRVVFEETEEQYVEEPTDWYITFLPDGKHFVVPSERDGYRHLYLCDVAGGKPVQLTSGKDEIIRVYGYSPKFKRVYYQGYDQDAMHKAVYSVSLDGKKHSRISKERGENFAWFNSDYTYYILYHSSMQSPMHVSLHKTAGSMHIRTLEDNAKLKELLNEYEFPRHEFFTFTTPEGNTLNGYMVKPADFDAKKKYPVLMYQYSGPNSQQVLDRWSLGWSDYLASRGAIVVCVDSRGTGGRGEAFRKCTYGELGHLESDDQIAAARWLAQQPYVDRDRIGIWGWSYGGYMSSLCLMRGSDVFRMAMSVAPVTNWKYYDSIYTERFMGLPQDNAKGYDAYTPITHAEKLKGELLIVHGSADDNVHFQNSMILVNKLIEKGIPFDMAVYPDRNHGIYGNGATIHLYKRLTKYVQQHLL